MPKQLKYDKILDALQKHSGKPKNFLISLSVRLLRLLKLEKEVFIIIFLPKMQFLKHW